MREGLSREKQVVLTDRDGRYAGLALAADLNVAADSDNEPVHTVARQRETTILPGTPIRRILAAFAEAETDILAVVDGQSGGKVLGTVTEGHVLRKYGEELERRNAEIVFG